MVLNIDISVPGDLNITGTINKSSAGFLMVYNPSGFFGAAFYYNMNTFLSTHNTNTYLYYLYDNLGNIYSGQFLTTRIVPYNVTIMSGLAYTATATLVKVLVLIQQHHLVLYEKFSYKCCGLFKN
jgi:hypothetical protein